MAQNFDVVVIGAGPGGYVAAIRAAQLGQKVAIIEKQHLGGICLNWGCIPTKALLKASETYHAITHAEDLGITVKGVDVDIAKIIQRSRDVAGGLNKGVGFLMKKNKVKVIEGAAKFTTPNSLSVELKDGGEETVTFKNAIIATGARAKQIPGILEADGDRIWTYKEAMTPKAQPKKLLVIGAGAIGIEFASFYNALGTEVTVVETLDRVLPIEDAEISGVVQKSLEKQGMEIITSAKAGNLQVKGESVTATIEANGKKEDRTFDNVLLAIGVSGNVEGLNLEEVGVKVERGAVKVDQFYRTGVPGIYAIGDVAGPPWLAHVASHEGVIAAEHAAGGHPHPMDYGNIPGCTYCTPQVGSVGMTEAKAKEEGYNIKVGRFNYQANGKALALGEPEGMVKTVFDADSGELLGAHIVGAEATEMVTTFVVARHMEATEQDFVHACLPHPTLSEMLGESVLDSDGVALNQ